MGTLSECESSTQVKDTTKDNDFCAGSICTKEADSAKCCKKKTEASATTCDASKINAYADCVRKLSLDTTNTQTVCKYYTDLMQCYDACMCEDSTYEAGYKVTFDAAATANCGVASCTKTDGFVIKIEGGSAPVNSGGDTPSSSGEGTPSEFEKTDNTGVIIGAIGGCL